MRLAGSCRACASCRAARLEDRPAQRAQPRGSVRAGAGSLPRGARRGGGTRAGVVSMSSSFSDKSTASWGPPRSRCPHNALSAADGCCDDEAGGGGSSRRARASIWSIMAETSWGAKRSSPLKALQSPSSSASCPNDGRGTWRGHVRAPTGAGRGARHGPATPHALRRAWRSVWRGPWRRWRCQPIAGNSVSWRAGQCWRARRVFDVLQLLNEKTPILCFGC